MPKTDLERAEKFFQSLGYTERHPVRDYHHGLRARQYSKTPEVDDSQIHLTFGDGLDEQHHQRFGYTGFGFVLAFTSTGEFLGHGAFE